MTGSRMIDGRLAAPIDRGSPVDRSFPKAYRLRLRREFVAVQASPLCVRGQLLLLAAQSDGDGRIGITVSKQVGNAVVRNRVRRRIREAIRHHGRAREKVRANWVPQGYNVVVIARRAAAHSHFFELQEELKRLRKRLPQ